MQVIEWKLFIIFHFMYGASTRISLSKSLLRKHHGSVHHLLLTRSCLFASLIFNIKLKYQTNVSSINIKLYQNFKLYKVIQSILWDYLNPVWNSQFRIEHEVFSRVCDVGWMCWMGWMGLMEHIFKRKLISRILRISFIGYRWCSFRIWYLLRHSATPLWRHHILDFEFWSSMYTGVLTFFSF